MDRREQFWFGTAGLLLAAAALVAGPSVTNFSWTGTPMRIAYVLMALALVCVLASVRGWPFPGLREHPVTPTDSADAIPRDPLLIEVLQEDWRDFRHLALILEARVKLTNRTDHRIRIRSFGFATEQRSPQWSISGDDWNALEREIAQTEQRLPRLNRHSQLDPAESESGWIVQAFGRPESGTPGYAIIIRDVAGNDYRKDVAPEPAQEYRS